MNDQKPNPTIQIAMTSDGSGGMPPEATTEVPPPAPVSEEGGDHPLEAGCGYLPIR